MLQRHLLAFCLILGLGLNANAQEGPANVPTGSQKAMHCTQDPEACQRLQGRLEGYCKDNPERCAEFRAKREEMRQKCAQDPAACEKQRQEMRAKARERFEERCKTDPQRCEAMKKRWEEHKGKHPCRDRDMPLPPPAQPPATK